MTQKTTIKQKKLDWYGVKTLFRTSAVGRPKGKDRAFDSKMTMVEERIVLFQARNFNDAIRQAEAEARRYTRSTHLNPYGQRVVCRYLGACDAYAMYYDPGVGIEVFSATEVIPKMTRDSVIVNQHLGKRETKREHRSRRNILNQEFSGTVYPVKSGRDK